GSVGSGGGGGGRGRKGTGSSTWGDVGTLIQETEQVVQQALDPNTDPLLPAVVIVAANSPLLIMLGVELLTALAIALPVAIIIGAIVTILGTTQGANGD